MAAAGYSGTPLAKKLGIKEGHDVALVGAPEGFAIPDLPPAVHTRDGLGGADGPLDVVLAFHTERAELEQTLPRAHAAIAQDGAIWVAWPKKASRVPTDITEDTVREVALPRGLVDNKVCAIDATWSGLRLVIRRELRKPTQRPM